MRILCQIVMLRFAAVTCECQSRPANQGGKFYRNGAAKPGPSAILACRFYRLLTKQAQSVSEKYLSQAGIHADR